jgi:hypothetical protein
MLGRDEKCYKFLKVQLEKETAWKGEDDIKLDLKVIKNYNNVAGNMDQGREV